LAELAFIPLKFLVLEVFGILNHQLLKCLYHKIFKQAFQNQYPELPFTF